MSLSAAQNHEVETLVGAYQADLAAAGMFAGHPATSYARSVLSSVGAEAWASSSASTPP